VSKLAVLPGKQFGAATISPRADISALIPTAADPSGRRVLSRGAQRSRRDAGGALDRSPADADNPGCGIREPSPIPSCSQPTGPRLRPGKHAADRARLLSSTRRCVPMSTSNDFRAAAGLKRWPSTLEDLPAEPPAPPRGPGLFQIARANGETAITNIRRLAGAERTPGSRLILGAALLLAALAAAFYVVTLAAQYHFVLGQKHEAVPSVIEALGLDAGMAVFALLALGLAMAGQSARTERMLVLACSLASAAMNYAAADVRSSRSILVYVMPPVFLAVTVDRVVAVVRRHVLGDTERSAWAAAGRALAAMARGFAVVLLYGLRFVLAPPSTGAGLRRVVLNAAPLPAAPERPELLAAGEVPAIGPPPATEPPELEGASKKARLAWWYQQDPDYGNRAAVGVLAKRLGAKVDLGEGTARAYLGTFLTELEGEGSRHEHRRSHTWARCSASCSRSSASWSCWPIASGWPRSSSSCSSWSWCCSSSWRSPGRARAGGGSGRSGSGVALAAPGPRVRLAAGIVGLRWGRMAAVSYGARSRPGLSLFARLTRPTTDYAVRLGRAQYLRRL